MRRFQFSIPRTVVFKFPQVLPREDVDLLICPTYRQYKFTRLEKISLSSSSILFELRFLKTERSQGSVHDATSWILIGIFLERIGLQSQILSWFPYFEVTESINCSIPAWDGYMIKQSIFPTTNAPSYLHPPKSNSLGGGVADKKYEVRSP